MQYEINLEDDFELKIGAHTIYVKFVDTKNDTFNLTDDNHGAWLPNKFTILVNKDDPYSMRLSTILHEIIHVFEYFYEVKITHRDLNLVGDAFAQVLLDNFKRE